MPTRETAEWNPGSFTKNYSWGPPGDGLLQLHEAIRVGFDNKAEDVLRDDFRNRIKILGRPDYIPLNFFLYNSFRDGQSWIIADELVFQAITSEHTENFDKLALFTFNLSAVGLWRGAKPGQQWPALWAYYYILNNVAGEYNWNTSLVNADDIENFLIKNKRYTGKTTRKLATNLSYLYKISSLDKFSNSHIERWWVDALFLALDRIIEERKRIGLNVDEQEYANFLRSYNFLPISGKRSLEKELGIEHLVTLYIACGGRDRFSDDSVKALTELALPDVTWLLANDNRPQGALHPTNPRILKSIPRACAFLAKYAGFEVIDADELATFDPEDFIRRHTRNALLELRKKQIKPTMTAEQLLKLTRDQ